MNEIRKRMVEATPWLAIPARVLKCTEPERYHHGHENRLVLPPPRLNQLYPGRQVPGGQ